MQHMVQMERFNVCELLQDPRLERWDWKTAKEKGNKRNPTFWNLKNKHYISTLMSDQTYLFQIPLPQSPENKTKTDIRIYESSKELGKLFIDTY